MKPSRRALWGSWAQKAFPCPPFLVCRKLASLSLQRGGSANKEGGDIETREEQSRNNSVALGQGPGSFSGDIQNNIIAELFCRTKAPK